MRVVYEEASNPYTFYGLNDDAQFITFCIRSEWSEYLTYSPFLALLAIAGSNACAPQYCQAPIRPNGAACPSPDFGPPSLVIDTLKRYEAAGVTDLYIRFAGTDQVAQLEQFIHEVVPVFTA